MPSPVSQSLGHIYQKLFLTFGPQHWWPGETPFEVIVGAILTQNTNWINVEKAIHNLKRAGLLTPQALHDVPSRKLAGLIKPSGYFNVKAKRLKNFMEFLFARYGGDLAAMRKIPLPRLRAELLSVNGIGPETADSILLYAFGKPTFVVDAYTKRIFYRHGIVPAQEEYHGVQKIFSQNLPAQVSLFNEYHALIVRLGKDFCKPAPACQKCPLNDLHYSLTSKCGVCHCFLPRSAPRFKYFSSRLNNKHKNPAYICRACYVRNKK